MASSGIEAFVTENNPKYSNRIIKQLKAYAKTQGFDKSYDPYKAAYGSMPSHASANPEIKQLYINGHFCYVFKFGIVTNGLGIIRHISFYNKDFMYSHPDIIIEKKSDSPDEDKSVHDSKLLIPTLKCYEEDMNKESNGLYKEIIGNLSEQVGSIYPAFVTGPWKLAPFVFEQIIQYIINADESECINHVIHFSEKFEKKITAIERKNACNCEEILKNER